MRTIESEADIAEGLAHLAKRDRRLRTVMKVAGERAAPPAPDRLHRPRPHRRRPAALGRQRRGDLGPLRRGLPGLRRRRHPPSRASDALRAAGLSAPKIRTLRAVAAACRDGLDLDALAELPAEEAHGRLTAIKGIGPWTADIYLLFCLGHPDIFPAGDLALRNAVADALRPRAADAGRRARRDGEAMVAVAGRRRPSVLGLLPRAAANAAAVPV